MQTTTTTVQSWGAVTPADQSLVYRVVGTLEYVSALRNLDSFLRSATLEEIAAADKIVLSRPQFTVFTRLAERFRPKGANDQVAGKAGSEQKVVQKRGLMWVVALARLEAGAILGTFTGLPAPFEIVGPTRFEMPAYKELLMDGAQTHFWALANDTNLPRVAKKIPDTEMLAYIRRLNLARDMLSAAARSNAKELSPQEWSQIAEQDKQLLSMRDGFSATVTLYVASLNYSSKSSSSGPEQTRSSVRACSAQLAGERAELAAGTATVQTFGDK